MTAIRTLLRAVLVFAALGASPGVADSCVSGRDGHQLVLQGKAMRLPDAMRRAGLSLTQILEVQLCPAAGGFVYRVKVLQPGGGVRAMNVPAN